MKRSHLVCSVFAALLLVGPITWRVLSWEQTEPQTIDTNMARAGEVLFKHEWQPNDPLSPNGDGLGPVFNARSCVACHHQAGPGGGGGVEHNVTTFLLGTRAPTQTGVIHAQATEEQHRETLKLLHPALPPISQPSLRQLVPVEGRAGQEVFAGPPPNVQVALRRGPERPLNLPPGVQLSQRNTPALFGAKWIDAIPEQAILANERAQRLRYGIAPGDGEQFPVGRAPRLPGGKVGRFGWKGQTARLAEFVQAACANELGLGNPAEMQPKSLANPAYLAPGLDLTQQQCDQLTAFVADLPRPVERLPDDPALHVRAAAGKALFTKVGCAACHTPNLGGVEGIYSDLLLHRMGSTLEGSGSSYGGVPPSTPESPSLASGPLPDEWRTPPLWGVADSAPYLHDGRAATLRDAITLHHGQAAASAEAFQRLSEGQRSDLVAFLQTLRAR